MNAKEHFGSDNATFAPDILKMESWTYMTHTAHIIIKDVIHIFASISKNMHILLMGRHYYECCNGLVPSGNKGLHELMLTKFYDTIWCH